MERASDNVQCYAWIIDDDGLGAHAVTLEPEHRSSWRLRARARVAARAAAGAGKRVARVSGRVLIGAGERLQRAGGAS